MNSVTILRVSHRIRIKYNYVCEVIISVYLCTPDVTHDIEFSVIRNVLHIRKTRAH